MPITADGSSETMPSPHLDDLIAVRLYRLGEMVGRVASLAFKEPYGTRITELRILSLL